MPRPQPRGSDPSLGSRSLYRGFQWSSCYSRPGWVSLCVRRSLSWGSEQAGTPGSSDRHCTICWKRGICCVQPKLRTALVPTGQPLTVPWRRPFELFRTPTPGHPAHVPGGVVCWRRGRDEVGQLTWEVTPPGCYGVQWGPWPSASKNQVTSAVCRRFLFSLPGVRGQCSHSRVWVAGSFRCCAPSPEDQQSLSAMGVIL